MTPTKTRCENCNHPIKHVYEWGGRKLGIECWKIVALPAIEAEREANRELKLEQWFQEDHALIEALRAKDYSKIRSEFKVTFLHDLVDQFDEKGFITQKQKQMVRGTGGWNGKFYDTGMLNDTDNVHEMVFLYFLGNDYNKVTAVNVAKVLPEKYQQYFQEATGEEWEIQ